jgi:hypothetical protein
MTHQLRASRALPAGVLCFALWLAPQAAQACSVCTGGQNDALRRAYLLGGLSMSALPLLAVTGLIFWLRRRARALAAPAPARVATARGVLPGASLSGAPSS